MRKLWDEREAKSRRDRRGRRRQIIPVEDRQSLGRRDAAGLREVREHAELQSLVQKVQATQ